MSKYKNSVFSYSVHSTVNRRPRRAKDTNDNLISFIRLFTEIITPERKVFFQNYMTNVVKIE